MSISPTGAIDAAMPHLFHCHYTLPPPLTRTYSLIIVRASKLLLWRLPMHWLRGLGHSPVEKTQDSEKKWPEFQTPPLEKWAGHPP